MYRATATALALVSFLPRVGVGYQPVDICCPPPCGCEAPPVVCCDPCEPSAPAPTKAHAKSPALLPTPADADAANAPPEENAAAELPESALAPNADAIAPQPLNTPAIVEATPLPAEAPAVQESAPAEPAPRYSEPPAAAPAAEEPVRDDDVFSEAPATTEPPAAETPEPATTEPETPAIETEPAEEPAAPAEEPATETPEGEELFGPSSSNEVLSQPGGWASDATRPWNDAEGQLLVTGRITEVTAKFVVLSREDGQSQAVRYAHLGDEDLSFLRQQIEARRVQLASQAGGNELLAEQSR